MLAIRPGVPLRKPSPAVSQTRRPLSSSSTQVVNHLGLKSINGPVKIIDGRIKLADREIAAIMRAKQPKYAPWNHEQHRHVILNLPSLKSTQEREKTKNNTTNSVIETIAQYTLENEKCLDDIDSMPVFSFLTPTKFKSARTLSKINNVLAHREITRGNYAYHVNLINFLSEKGRCVHLDSIITGNKETIEDPYLLFQSDHIFLTALINEVVMRAVSEEGLSEKDHFVNIPVLQFNKIKNDKGEHFSELGTLLTMPLSAKKFIKDDNYTILPNFKDYGHIIVLGRGKVDPRDVHQQSLEWTARMDTLEANKPSYRLEKKPENLIEKDVEKIGLTNEELTAALQVEPPNRGYFPWNFTNRLETLSNLPSLEFTKQLANLQKKELLKFKGIEQGIYLTETLERHKKHFPNTKEHLPVFKAVLDPDTKKIQFIYCGSLRTLFDQIARKKIIMGDYEYGHSLFDSKNSCEQLDTIIVGNVSGNIARVLLNIVLKEIIEQALQTPLKMGDLYSDIPLYKELETAAEDGRRYKFIDHYLGTMPDWAKECLEQNNYTLLPHCISESTPLTNHHMKSNSVIVLGIKNADPAYLFDQYAGRY